MKYQKGLHIICDLDSVPIAQTSNMHEFKMLVEDLVEKHQLQITGSVYYPFENKGYTAVIGLTESHLSVHTWPEFGKVTFDIFLSNFSRINDGTCLNIAEIMKTYFGGMVSQEVKLNR